MKSPAECGVFYFNQLNNEQMDLLSKLHLEAGKHQDTFHQPGTTAGY